MGGLNTTCLAEIAAMTATAAIAAMGAMAAFATMAVMEVMAEMAAMAAMTVMAAMALSICIQISKIETMYIGINAQNLKKWLRTYNNTLTL